jgi:hypothetical protein
MRRLILSLVAFAAFTGGGAMVVFGNENSSQSLQAPSQSGGLGGGTGAGGMLHGKGIVIARPVSGGGGGNMMGTGGGNMMGTGGGGGT